MGWPEQHRRKLPGLVGRGRARSGRHRPRHRRRAGNAGVPVASASSCNISKEAAPGGRISASSASKRGHPARLSSGGEARGLHSRSAGGGMDGERPAVPPRFPQRRPAQRPRRRLGSGKYLVRFLYNPGRLLRPLHRGDPSMATTRRRAPDVSRDHPHRHWRGRSTGLFATEAPSVVRPPTLGAAWNTYQPVGGRRWALKDRDGLVRVRRRSHHCLSTTTMRAQPGQDRSPCPIPVAMCRCGPWCSNRPFKSVGELGYVLRDQPWKTLNFSPRSLPSGCRRHPRPQRRQRPARGLHASGCRGHRREDRPELRAIPA